MCTSTVKTKNKSQDGRAAFLALIAYHAGDEKYRSIAKKRYTQLMSNKRNGKVFSLEKHVSNHRQCYKDLVDCHEHVRTQVPGEDQRVQYLIDSIECGDQAIHAAVGLIRNDVNGTRSDFEKAASSLIGVDPYVKGRSRVYKERAAQISSLDCKAGRGGSGVDLRWHT